MLEKITEMLKEQTCKDDLTVTEDTTFADLELDSLDTVDLVMKLEDEFNVKIDMSEPLKSIGDLIKIIEQAK